MNDATSGTRDRVGEPTGRGRPRAPLVFWAGVGTAVLVFFLGAWERRWIADDGLIVLRTVRNLMAGNGPVFNQGERVESNTSTAWTYLVWISSEIAPYRIELVALTLALTLSMGAVVMAMYGTKVMYLGTPRAAAGTAVVLLPFGILVYIVLPPARDFATSGLETGLILAWISCMWMLMQIWARTPHRELRFGLPVPLVALIAFLAGLSPLVRPELALVGMAVLGLLAVSRGSWIHLAWGVLIAATVPAVYQVWRMSYYGLPYPITAVAKDAGGSKWESGFLYLWDLVSPYGLLIPAALLLVGASAVWVAARWVGPRRAEEAPGDAGPAGDGTDDDPRRLVDILVGPETRARWAESSWAGRAVILRDGARSTRVVTLLFLLAGLVMLLYVLRVGGDFMHGRVLLPPLFLLLLPVSVVPVPLGAPRGDREARSRRVAVPVVVGSWLVIVGWGVFVHVTEDAFREDPEQISASGIVDERQFYVQRTGHRHPILATDYQDYPRIAALTREVQNNRTGALLFSRGGVHDSWEVVSYDQPLPGHEPYELPDEPPHTVVFLNLGMTSMNLPLDVKVYDTVGLATPLAAHTDRMVDGRIGHDKYLPYDWFYATSGVVTDPHNLPPWVDPDWVEQARVALTCPATQAMFESYMAPLTPERRWNNFVNAFSFAEYRLNRVPEYEVQRCGLPMPPEVEIERGTG